MKKKLIIIFTIVVFLGIGTFFTYKFLSKPTIELVNEEKYNGNDASNFSMYYKNKKGEFKLVGNYYFDKYVSTKEFKINKKIYGIKIVKNNGYELNLDELTLEQNTDKNYEKKLSQRDNDLIEIEKEIELEVEGKGKLLISGRAPLTLGGTELALHFPSRDEYLSYKLNSNKETFSEDELVIPANDYLFYHQDEVVTGSGHPTAPIDYYVANDKDYLYVFTEAFGDNTFDHGKDYSKVYVKTKKGIKEYQVNTVEENEHGKWWFEYTNTNKDVKWQHMAYLVKVPMKDLKGMKTIDLSFEYYGTVCGSIDATIFEFAKKDTFNNNIPNAEFKLTLANYEEICGTDDVYDCADKICVSGYCEYGLSSTLKILREGVVVKSLGGTIENNVLFNFSAEVICYEFDEEYANIVNSFVLNLKEISAPKGYIKEDKVFKVKPHYNEKIMCYSDDLSEKNKYACSLNSEASNILDFSLEYEDEPLTVINNPKALVESILIDEGSKKGLVNGEFSIDNYYPLPKVDEASWKYDDEINEYVLGEAYDEESILYDPFLGAFKYYDGGSRYEGYLVADVTDLFDISPDWKDKNGNVTEKFYHENYWFKENSKQKISGETGEIETDVKYGRLYHIIEDKVPTNYLEEENEIWFYLDENGAQVVENIEIEEIGKIEKKGKINVENIVSDDGVVKASIVFDNKNMMSEETKEEKNPITADIIIFISILFVLSVILCFYYYKKTKRLN